MRLHYRVRGFFRFFEMHRQGAIAPRVVQAMAAICDEAQLDSEFLCGGIERARLVAQFRRKYRYSWMWLSSGHFQAHRKDSACFTACFALAIGTNWSRVGSA